MDGCKSHNRSFLFERQEVFLSTSSYKFTFRINASHKAVQSSSVHSHTFLLVLYIRCKSERFDAFERIEAVVRQYLSAYANKNLHEVPPFDQIVPTIENMGEEFFLRISELLDGEDYELSALEISETPQRFCRITREELTEERRADWYAALLRAQRVPAPELLFSDEESSDKDPGPQVSEVMPDISYSPPKSLTEPVKSGSTLLFFLSAAIVVVAGFLMMTYVRISGIYPLGLDIHGHLFKADLLYHEMQKGNFYPLYTQYWYNGVQVFRYWPPLPYYLLAGLQFLAGGSVISAYLGFVWLSLSVGGIGWLLFGYRYNRMGLALFMGFLWFFLPDNLRVFFGEGNLPRMVITMLLPYFFFFMWQFVAYARKSAIFPLVTIMLGFVFCHLMISAMVGVACAIFLLIYAITNKKILAPLQVILCLLFTFAVAGIWVLPALVGGLTSMSSDANSTLMASLSAPFSISLNPLLRLNGQVTELYFGLSIFVIAFLGLFLAGRKSFSGFLTFLLIVFGTSTALLPLIQHLPFSYLFWIRRFTPIVYALFLISLMEWKDLKRVFLMIFCSLIALDSVYSFNLEGYNDRMNIPATVGTITDSMDKELFTKAKEITKQRVSLMDLSILGPLPSYAFGTLEPKTQYVFGWAWQGASTANNIAYLNEAFEKENYLYVFDRNLELGADSVLVDKSQLTGEEDRAALDAAATKVGYQVAAESDRTVLYSYPVESAFGVVSDYTGIAIGTTAELVPGILPSFCPGDKLTIDDYTADELSKYKIVYLSGFFYNNKEKAEALVREIADRGVQVYIDMNRIPSDPLTTRMTFLNVSAQPITFIDRFPTLTTQDGSVKAAPFAEGYEKWNTVYLTGLTRSEGQVVFENTKLDFAGKTDSDNITFIGFNLLFHAYTTDDVSVKSVLNSLMNLDEDSLPQRTVVPLSIEYGTDTITIQSPEDNVNTTLAWQDIFESDQPIRSANNLLIVDKGTTVIHLHYPYLGKGLLVSAVGIACEAGIFFWVFRKPRKRQIQVQK